MSEPMNLGT